MTLCSEGLAPPGPESRPIVGEGDDKNVIGFLAMQAYRKSVPSLESVTSAWTRMPEASMGRAERKAAAGYRQRCDRVDCIATLRFGQEQRSAEILRQEALN
jgi:hypothetical protein